jgi:hypothetical protein
LSMATLLAITDGASLFLGSPPAHPFAVDPIHADPGGDVVNSPQVLGRKLIVMLLSGEYGSRNFVMKHKFQRKREPAAES